MQKQSNQRKLATTISDIPEGFTIGTGPDGQQYLVPQYMVPALDHAFASYQSKADLGFRMHQGGRSALDLRDSHRRNRPFWSSSRRKIMFPPDPQLSDHERLTLHAEAVYGRTREAQSCDETYKAFKNLDSRIETSLKTLQAQFGDPKANAEADAEVIPDADAE
ncbi:hypothetical protein BDZ97DRAFT_1929973 [Flammula alnicola]|nr:hypothetical protein BDZ97DRAFT_1929973 [Flammula alnicola]